MLSCVPLSRFHLDLPAFVKTAFYKSLIRTLFFSHQIFENIGLKKPNILKLYISATLKCFFKHCTWVVKKVFSFPCYVHRWSSRGENINLGSVFLLIFLMRKCWPVLRKLPTLQHPRCSRRGSSEYLPVFVTTGKKKRKSWPKSPPLVISSAS